MRTVPLASLTLLVLLAAPAAGHAQIARSEPPGGAVLETAPQEVTLWLTEPVDQETLELVVVDQDRRRVDAGEIRFTGPRGEPVLTRALAEGTGDGAYTVRLTATSLTDSHRVTYTRGFAVGGFAPPPSGSEDGLDALGFAGRGLAYLGLAAASAAIAFAFLVPDSRTDTRRLHGFLLGGAAVHLAGSLLILAAARPAGQSWSAFADGPVGGWLLLRADAALLGLLMARLAVGRGPTAWAGAAVPLAVAALAGSRFSHASQAGPLLVLDVLAHLLLGAVWVGGLALLAGLVGDARRRGDLDAVQRMGLRFSSLALVSVGVVFASGLLATSTILGPARLDPDAYLGGPWGRALVGKVLLALAMVAVAGLHRFVFLDQGRLRAVGAAVQRLAARVRPDVAPLRSGEPAVRSFQALLALETVFGVAVLVLAGLLTSLSPPGPADADDALRVTGSGDDFLIALHADPRPAAGAASDLRFVIQYRPDHPDGRGEVVNDTCGREGCVLVRIEPEGAEGEPENLFPEPGADGWVLRGYTWLRPGPHAVTVEVQTDVVFRDIVEMTLPVRAADGNG